MGAYHFKLYLVPPGVTPLRDEKGCYAGDFLASYCLPAPVVQRLRQIFTRTNHWGSVEEYVSDHEWGSDLRIFHAAAGDIEQITFRYSPAADPVDKLQAFIAAATEAGCSLLVSSSGAVIAPEFEQVFSALRSHHAFRFLSDPEGALVEAAQNIKENESRRRESNS